MNQSKQIFIALICLLFSASIFSQAKVSKIQLALDSIYKANPESVGIMVHIEAPDQNISWSGAVGFSDKIKLEPLQADQPALIASNTKTYVSVAILRLIEKGEIHLYQAIENLLTEKSKNILKNDGYDLKSITIAHLLSHTSGIMDYVNEDYMNFISSNKMYRWTRDEQIALAAKVGDPLGQAGDTFSYADVNYLLLTEIIENITNKNFNQAIAELVGYEKHKFQSSWFVTLDDKPVNIKPLVHQYYGKLDWDSYQLDPSFDLYGGGGIASTTKDLARFYQLLFEGKIVEKPEVLDLIFTKIKTKDEKDAHYLMGLSESKTNGLRTYSHGGFWGTVVKYIPKLNASISVFVLERDKRVLRKDILEKITAILHSRTDISNNILNSKIASYLNELKDFSGTILVAKNDQVLEKRAYGLANIEYNVKNKITTQFNIASITKMLTSVATLQLYEQGKIELHKPIGIYLKDYPNKSVRDSVTIHQLLTHTAGTIPFYRQGYLKTGKLSYRTISDYLPLFQNDSLMFSPGSQYHYNGSGFVILGLIIEKISGQSYYDFLYQNILLPSNMHKTAPIDVDSIVYNKASGYTSFFGEKKILKRNDYYISKASPGGGYYSTIDDLFAFSKALRTYKLLNKKTTELMFAPKVKGYNTHLGYGIDVDQRYNQIILGHSGGWYGIRAELMDFIDTHYTFVVLSNIDDNGESGASKVINDFKDLIADKKN